MVPSTSQEYTARSSPRRQSASSVRRILFFCFASSFGFLVGVAGLLAAMAATGRPALPRAVVIAGLVPSLALALAGGLVIAAAYKEAKRRSHR